MMVQAVEYAPGDGRGVGLWLGLSLGYFGRHEVNVITKINNKKIITTLSIFLFFIYLVPILSFIIKITMV